MNWLDWILVVLLAFGIYRGIRRGLLRQVLGLSALVIAFIFGYLHMDTVGTWFENQVGIPMEYSSVIGFLCVFFSAFLVLSIVSGFLDKIVRNIPIIGWLNQLIGGALGLISSALLLSLIVYLLSLIGLPSNEIINSSMTYDYIYQLLPQTWDLMTSEFPEITDIAERFPSWF